MCVSSAHRFPARGGRLTMGAIQGRIGAIQGRNLARQGAVDLDGILMAAMHARIQSVFPFPPSFPLDLCPVSLLSCNCVTVWLCNPTTQTPGSSTMNCDVFVEYPIEEKRMKRKGGV